MALLRFAPALAYNSFPGRAIFLGFLDCFSASLGSLRMTLRDASSPIEEGTKNAQSPVPARSHANVMHVSYRCRNTPLF